MAKTTELDAAYRATTYRVFLPGGGCDLRLGVLSETLRCWRRGVRECQFLADESICAVEHVRPAK